MYQYLFLKKAQINKYRMQEKQILNQNNHLNNLAAWMGES